MDAARSRGIRRFHGESNGQPYSPASSSTVVVVLVNDQLVCC
ncbi:hypothetical protein ACP70R_000384 [Stipagrostis hirtigluma subsp. patula]